MIVGELSHQPFEIRKKFWFEKLQLPLQWKEITADDLSSPMKFLQDPSFDGLLLDESISEIVLPNSSRLPEEIREAGLADSLIRENGKIWMRCFLREALKLLMLQKAPRLDTHSTCYVTGSQSLARLCAVIAIQFGFDHLVFVSEDEARAMQLVEEINRLFFGLKLRTLHESELTLQPNNGSLLMNTLSAETGGVIFEDLTYLNFLKKEGLVVDLPMAFQMNPLLDEASHVGAHFLCGSEIWGLRDYLFLKNLLKDQFSISAEDYLSQWKSFGLSENQT